MKLQNGRRRQTFLPYKNSCTTKIRDDNCNTACKNSVIFADRVPICSVQLSITIAPSKSNSHHTMSVPVYYSWQGWQPLRMAGWAN